MTNMRFLCSPVVMVLSTEAMKDPDDITIRFCKLRRQDNRKRRCGIAGAKTEQFSLHGPFNMIVFRRVVLAQLVRFLVVELTHSG
jgi:hypothetical protein